MLMLIGFGLCISAYYIYQNKENVLMNIAKAGVKLEDIYLNYVGMSVSFLVPDHSNSSLIDQCNRYYLDRYVSNLSHSDNYNKTNNEYFVILKYNIKRKVLCYVKNSFTFSDIIITEEDVNFSSPIILCSVSIYETNQETNERTTLFSDIDVTQCFNNLVTRNSKLILSNTNKYKEFWIYYFNYFLQNRNIFINTDNLNNIEIEWNIMDSNIKTTKGSELLVVTNNSSTEISIIESNESLHINEDEYDSIDDLNKIDFSQKLNADINNQYVNDENTIQPENNEELDGLNQDIGGEVFDDEEVVDEEVEETNEVVDEDVEETNEVVEEEVEEEVEETNEEVEVEEVVEVVEEVEEVEETNEVEEEVEETNEEVEVEVEEVVKEVEVEVEEVVKEVEETNDVEETNEVVEENQNSSSEEVLINNEELEEVIQKENENELLHEVVTPLINNLLENVNEVIQMQEIDENIQG
jgi:hypothetical protein